MTIGDIGKYIKVKDIYHDEKRLMHVENLKNSESVREEERDRLEEAIEENSMRDEKLRQNLYFLFEKKLV